jgi:hypothetical protein
MATIVFIQEAEFGNQNSGVAGVQESEGRRLVGKGLMVEVNGDRFAFELAENFLDLTERRLGARTMRKHTIP